MIVLMGFSALSVGRSTLVLTSVLWSELCCYGITVLLWFLWFQCSKCIDKYEGTPTHGHQCYLEMSVKNGYCYESHTGNKSVPEIDKVLGLVLITEAEHKSTTQ